MNGPDGWVERAACKGYGHLFVMPDRPRAGRPPARAQAARQARAVAICATCPVLEQCRQWASSDPDPAVGMVAGGLTPTQRRLRFNRDAPFAALVIAIDATFGDNPVDRGGQLSTGFRRCDNVSMESVH